jgi:hypothetical protein
MINTSNLFTAKMASNCLWACILLLITACSNQGSVEGMLSYMEEKKDMLQCQAVGNELSTQLNYIPCDMAAARDYQLSGGQGEPFEAFKKEYQQTLEFNFHIRSKEGIIGITKRIKESEEHDFMLTYYNYQANNDIKMVAGTDTIPCKYFHAIQSGGLQDELLFSCGFDKKMIRNADKITVLYFDRIFGKDIYQYSFKTKQIEGTPEIIHYSSTLSK